MLCPFPHDSSSAQHSKYCLTELINVTEQIRRKHVRRCALNSVVLSIASGASLPRTSWKREGISVARQTDCWPAWWSAIGPQFGGLAAWPARSPGFSEPAIPPGLGAISSPLAVAPLPVPHVTGDVFVGRALTPMGGVEVAGRLPSLAVTPRCSNMAAILRRSSLPTAPCKSGLGRASRSRPHGGDTSGAAKVPPSQT